MRSHYLLRWSSLAVALIAGAACASNPLPPAGAVAADQYVTLVVRGGAQQAKLEGNEFYGPRVRLTFFPDGVRGVVDDELASFQVGEGGKIVGTIGGRPVDLYVRQGADWMTINGLFAGQMSDLRVNTGSIQGNVGRCGYTLRARGDEPGAFPGRRACRGMPEDASLLLPPAFAGRPASQRAVILATILAGHS